MLSEEEKREMLEDGKSQSRRDHFRFARSKDNDNLSFDGYLTFLNQVQEIFSPFEVSRSITLTKLNIL